MIVIKVELHSAITGEVTTLVEGKIRNDGTGTPGVGNYEFEAGRKGGGVARRSRVEGFPRGRLNVWHLLARCLGAAEYK